MSNLTSKRLRLVQKGYENYSGPIGQYEFVEGLSVELIPFSARERLAAAFQMVEINEDGVEIDASVADRLLREKLIFADKIEPLVRQTEEEKTLENIGAIVGNEVIKALYSVKALEKVATEKGIAGVRVVAEPWSVRSKSIPDLIRLIAKAQSDYALDRVASLAGKGVPEVEARALFVFVDEVPAAVFEADASAVPRAPKPETVTEPVAKPVTEPELNIAAASGDFAAAISIAADAAASVAEAAVDATSASTSAVNHAGSASAAALAGATVTASQGGSSMSITPSSIAISASQIAISPATGHETPASE